MFCISPILIAGIVVLILWLVSPGTLFPTDVSASHNDTSKKATNDTTSSTPSPTATTAAPVVATAEPPPVKTPTKAATLSRTLSHTVVVTLTYNTPSHSLSNTLSRAGGNNNNGGTWSLSAFSASQSHSDTVTETVSRRITPPVVTAAPPGPPPGPPGPTPAPTPAPPPPPSRTKTLTRSVQPPPTGTATIELTTASLTASLKPPPTDSSTASESMTRGASDTVTLAASRSNSAETRSGSKPSVSLESHSTSKTILDTSSFTHHLTESATDTAATASSSRTLSKPPTKTASSSDTATNSDTVTLHPTATTTSTRSPSLTMSLSSSASTSTSASASATASESATDSTSNSDSTSTSLSSSITASDTASSTQSITASSSNTVSTSNSDTNSLNPTATRTISFTRSNPTHSASAPSDSRTDVVTESQDTHSDTATRHPTRTATFSHTRTRSLSAPSPSRSLSFVDTQSHIATTTRSHVATETNSSSKTQQDTESVTATPSLTSLSKTNQKSRTPRNLTKSHSLTPLPPPPTTTWGPTYVAKERCTSLVCPKFNSEIRASRTKVGSSPTSVESIRGNIFWPSTFSTKCGVISFASTSPGNTTNCLTAARTCVNNAKTTAGASGNCTASASACLVTYSECVLEASITWREYVESISSSTSLADECGWSDAFRNSYFDAATAADDKSSSFLDCRVFVEALHSETSVGSCAMKAPSAPSSQEYSTTLCNVVIARQRSLLDGSAASPTPKQTLLDLFAWARRSGAISSSSSSSSTSTTTPFGLGDFAVRSTNTTASCGCQRTTTTSKDDSSTSSTSSCVCPAGKSSFVAYVPRYLFSAQDDSCDHSSSHFDICETASQRTGFNITFTLRSPVSSSVPVARLADEQAATTSSSDPGEECNQRSGVTSNFVVLGNAATNPALQNSPTAMNLTICASKRTAVFLLSTKHSGGCVQQSKPVDDRNRLLVSESDKCVCESGADVTSLPIVIINGTTTVAEPALLVICSTPPPPPPTTFGTINAILTAISALAPGPAVMQQQSAALITLIDCDGDVVSAGGAGSLVPGSLVYDGVLGQWLFAFVVIVGIVVSQILIVAWKAWRAAADEAEERDQQQQMQQKQEEEKQRDEEEERELEQQQNQQQHQPEKKASDEEDDQQIENYIAPWLRSLVSEEATRKRVKHGMTSARFPSRALLIMRLFYSGFAYASVLLVARSDSDDVASIAAGVVGILLVLAWISFFIFVGLIFRRDDHKLRKALRVRYRKAFVKSIIGKLVGPVFMWKETALVCALDWAIDEFDPRTQHISWLPVLAYFRAFLFSFFAGVKWNSGSQCTSVMFLVLLSNFFLGVFASTYSNAYRYKTDNFFNPIMALLTCLMTVGMLLGSGEGGDGPAALDPILIGLVLNNVGTVSSALNLTVTLYDICFAGKIEDDAAKAAEGAAAGGETDTEEDSIWSRGALLPYPTTLWFCCPCVPNLLMPDGQDAVVPSAHDKGESSAIIQQHQPPKEDTVQQDSNDDDDDDDQQQQQEQAPQRILTNPLTFHDNDDSDADDDGVVSVPAAAAEDEQQQVQEQQVEQQEQQQQEQKKQEQQEEEDPVVQHINRRERLQEITSRMLGRPNSAIIAGDFSNPLNPSRFAPTDLHTWKPEGYFGQSGGDVEQEREKIADAAARRFQWDRYYKSKFLKDEKEKDEEEKQQQQQQTQATPTRQQQQQLYDEAGIPNDDGGIDDDDADEQCRPVSSASPRPSQDEYLPDSMVRVSRRPVTARIRFPPRSAADRDRQAEASTSNNNFFSPASSAAAAFSAASRPFSAARPQRGVAAPSAASFVLHEGIHELEEE